MKIEGNNSIHMPLGQPGAAAAQSAVAGSFDKLLNQVTVEAAGAEGAGAGGKSLDTSEARKRAESAAAGLVSNALILPVLKQLRRSPWGGDGVFSGGSGEKSFGPQFDMQLADRIAHSPRLGIKNALADRLMKRGLAKQATTNKGFDVNG